MQKECKMENIEWYKLPMMIGVPSENQKNKGEIIYTPMKLKEFCSMFSPKIPIAFIFQLLDFSENQFVGLLNGNINEYIQEYNRYNRLSTNCEDDYLKYKSRGDYFFTKKRLSPYMHCDDWYQNGLIFVYGEINFILPKESITVEYKDFMNWLSKNNNYEHLKEYHMQIAERRRISRPISTEMLTLRNEIEALTAENARLQDKIAELEAEAEKAEPKTTVDAKRWKACTEAVLKLYREIWVSEDQEKVYLKDEFYDKLHRMTKADYHTTVDRLAWDYLPDKYKHGPGRPKKEKE